MIHCLPASIESTSVKASQNDLIPFSFTPALHSSASTYRSGRMLCVYPGCTVLDNHAIVEMARASSSGSDGSRFFSG